MKTEFDRTLSFLKAIAELPCLCGNPTSNLTGYHLTVVGFGEGGVGAPKKKLLKNINETFHSVWSRKKRIFDYMGREASMLYSYFWTLAHGNCSVCATEIIKSPLPAKYTFLKINSWNTKEHENHALSGLNLKKNKKKKE